MDRYSFDDIHRHENTKHSIFDVLILFLSAVIFISSIGVMIYVNRSNEKSVSVIPSFKLAMTEGRYDDALQMYRNLQENVLEANPDDDSEQIKKDAATMTEMEAIVEEQFNQLTATMLSERYELNSKDITFLSEMHEIVSYFVGGWMNKLCEDFILGKLEKPDAVFIFNQMLLVDNLTYLVNPLFAELDSIEKSQGNCEIAEAYYNNGDYVKSVQAYQAVADSASGFVLDFSLSRVNDIKEIMHQPMIDEGEHMLDRFQYYSAEELFSDLAVIFPDDQRINSDLLEATSHTCETAEYYGTVQVLCIRQLIADNEVAFGVAHVETNEDLFLTTSEFEKILEQLYQNDYVLVDAESLADLSNTGYLVEQSLVVPVGKKPVVLVIEALDYSVHNISSGCCSRLILNDQNQICGEYTDSLGNNVVSRKAEAIGILDEFIEKHPDFSYNGAKGVISLCGYEACFGYVVDEDELDDRNLALTSNGFAPIDLSAEEIEVNRTTVKNIAAVLIDTGWKFASSTYGNINAADSDMETIQGDIQKWITQIGSLLGEVHIIVYPGGNYIKGTDDRANYLKSLGFRIFMGVGANPYYIYGDNYLYYDRNLINASLMRTRDYSNLFDVYYCYDEDRNTELN